MKDATRPMLVALMTLTFVTGIVDAVSVLALGHVFTANMTGNVVFLGFALAGRGATSVAASVEALGAFLVGACVGGALLREISPRSLRLGFGLEVLSLSVAAGAAFAESTIATLAAVALVAFAMGLRNAAVRKLGVPDMTTTVLTLTVTGLAADSSLAGGTNPRWLRRVTAVLAMLAGAAIGAALLTAGRGIVVVTAAVLESIAVVVLVRSHEASAAG